MLTLACLCHTANAENENSSADKPLAATSEEAPSLAFLEYLAELQKVDGKWVSPMDMLDNQDSKLQVVHEQQPANDETQKAESKNIKGDDKTVVKEKTDKEVEQ